MNRQIIDFESENQRLDVVLGMLYPDVSRSRFQKLITEGQVKVNGANVKPSYKCSVDDEVDIDF